MPYALGIDLGSGRTTAAISRNDRERWLEPEVVALDGDPAGVGSVLHVTEQDAVEVGASALRALPRRAGWVARDVAGRVGDEIPVMLGGQPYPAEVLTAALVGWVVDQVEATEGVPASQLVVTHPAGWGMHRRALLLGALREVDLPEPTLLPRPVAAAECHAGAQRVEVGEEIAVYSLGSGRFESAVLRRGAFGFELRAHADGVEPVGGTLFDDLLTEHVIAELKSPPEGVSLAKLRLACTTAKERLSTESSVSVSGVRVTRAEFEELIRPAVESTVESLRRTIRSAAGESVGTVVLVGGCGRIPLVTELVAAGTRARVVAAADPETSIARGAAVAAARVAKPTVRATALTMTPEPIARSAVTHTDLMRLDDLPEEDLTDLGPPPPRPPVEIAPLEPPKRRLLRLGGRDKGVDLDRPRRRSKEDREFADLDLAPASRRRKPRRGPEFEEDLSRESAVFEEDRERIGGEADDLFDPLPGEPRGAPADPGEPGWQSQRRRRPAGTAAEPDGRVLPAHHVSGAPTPWDPEDELIDAESPDYQPIHPGDPIDATFEPLGDDVPDQQPIRAREPAETESRRRSGREREPYGTHQPADVHSESSSRRRRGPEPADFHHPTHGSSQPSRRGHSPEQDPIDSDPTDTGSSPSRRRRRPEHEPVHSHPADTDPSPSRRRRNPEPEPVDLQHPTHTDDQPSRRRRRPEHEPIDNHPADTDPSPSRRRGGPVPEPADLPHTTDTESKRSRRRHPEPEPFDVHHQDADPQLSRRRATNVEALEPDTAHRADRYSMSSRRHRGPEGEPGVTSRPDPGTRPPRQAERSLPRHPEASRPERHPHRSEPDPALPLPPRRSAEPTSDLSHRPARAHSLTDPSPDHDPTEADSEPPRRRRAPDRANATRQSEPSRHAPADSEHPRRRRRPEHDPLAPSDPEPPRRRRRHPTDADHDYEPLHPRHPSDADADNAPPEPPRPRRHRYRDPDDDLAPAPRHVDRDGGRR